MIDMAFPKLNKKDVLIIAGFVVLTGLLIQSLSTNAEMLNDSVVTGAITNLVISHLSIKNYENTGEPYDFVGLVAEYKSAYCNVIEGTWNEQTEECLGASEKYCRLIGGSTNFTGEPGKTGQCILE